jgi:hypothetical protein
LSAEVSVQRVESKYVGMRLVEVGRGQSTRDEQGQSVRARQSRCAGREDFSVVEDRTIGGAQPDPQRRIIKPFIVQTQLDHGAALRKSVQSIRKGLGHYRSNYNQSVRYTVFCPEPN